MNDDDFTIASLAKLVGQELHTIDNNTITGKSGPANKLDPRSFLDQRRPQTAKNPYTARHDGMVFHAGVDESVVQNMYPDPPSSGRVAPPQQLQQLQQPHSHTGYISPPTVYQETPPAKTDAGLEYYQNNEKLLKSIDKTLKSIDKTQKALVDALSKFNSNISIA